MGRHYVGMARLPVKKDFKAEKKKLSNFAFYVSWHLGIEVNGVIVGEKPKRVAWWSEYNL